MNRSLLLQLRDQPGSVEVQPMLGDASVALWPDTHVVDANLTNVIVALRKALGRDAIQTVSKYGYRCTLPVLGEPGIHQATYATFVQAKEQATLRSLESMARARDLFGLCVAQDPQFAAAWAWMGRCSRLLEKLKGGSSVNLELAQAALRRALAIDPHLACAHHFYTQLQIDLGESRAAAMRLVERIAERGGEAESFAGLVHALRFCGMLDESVAASARAAAIDPTTITSVPHTHFLRCDYHATIDTYGQTRYYLDAAAWAALGDATRAMALLRERLATSQLSPLIAGLMRSLLMTLEQRRDEAMATIQALQVEREPEVLFYLARHLGLLNAPAECVRMLQRARTEGFTASYTLDHDAAFTGVRRHAGFRKEVVEARRVEAATRQAVDAASGGRLRRLLETV